MRHPYGTSLTLVAIAAATLGLAAQTPSPTATPSPPQGAAPAQGQPPAGDPAAGRGRGGRGAPMWEPDFSKKPPVQPLTAAEQQKKFWLPPGFKLEPVLTEPDIEEPAQIAFDGN